MKPHGAGGNKFRISDILVQSCSLIIKNITSLLILFVALFLVLGCMYDSVEDRFSELAQHDYVSACMEAFKQLDLYAPWAIMERRYSESGGYPLFTAPSPAAFIFFSFLLPVAVIRLLFAGDPPKGSFIERAFHNYRFVPVLDKDFTVAVFHDVDGEPSRELPGWGLFHYRGHGIWGQVNYPGPGYLTTVCPGYPSGFPPAPG